jgi:hypothetical protein
MTSHLVFFQVCFSASVFCFTPMFCATITEEW